MNSAPGRTGRSNGSRPGRSRLVGGQPHQQLGLQRIGVLELVDQQVAEAALEVVADVRVVAHQVAGPDQKVEEVHGAGALLPCLVAGHGPLQRLVHERRQIGIGAVAERHQCVHDHVAGGDDLRRAALPCVYMPLVLLRRRRSRSLAASPHNAASHPS